MRTFVLLLLAVATASAADLDALADRLGSRDAKERAAAVEALADVPGDEAGKLLARALGDRDAEVRIAAAKALGGRDDEPSRKALRRALDRFAKDPDLLPVVVVSLGASGDAAAAEDVAALLRKALGADARLARAAIDALGSIRAKASVAGLMEALSASADPRGAAHPEYRDEVLDSLREATGLPFREPATWQEWWRHAKRDYAAAAPGPPAEGDLYRSDGWRFTIEKPAAKEWEFSQPEGAAIRIVWRGSSDEAVFAWIDVLVRSATEPKERTAEEVAAEYRKHMETELADVRDAEWGEPARIGRENALRHAATGILSGGSVVRWRAFFLERSGILYTVTAHVESGASEAVRKAVDGVLDSFRVLD